MTARNAFISAFQLKIRIIEKGSDRDGLLWDGEGAHDFRPGSARFVHSALFAHVEDMRDESTAVIRCKILAGDRATADRICATLVGTEAINARIVPPHVEVVTSEGEESNIRNSFHTILFELVFQP